jgi:hypothetical protein
MILETEKEKKIAGKSYDALKITHMQAQTQ